MLYTWNKYNVMCQVYHYNVFKVKTSLKALKFSYIIVSSLTKLIQKELLYSNTRFFFTQELVTNETKDSITENF